VLPDSLPSAVRKLVIDEFTSIAKLVRVAAVLANEDIAQTVVLVVSGRMSQKTERVGHRDIDKIS